MDEFSKPSVRMTQITSFFFSFLILSLIARPIASYNEVMPAGIRLGISSTSCSGVSSMILFTYVLNVYKVNVAPSLSLL